MHCRADAVDHVIERTGGVPLFVEELTRAVLERADAKPTAREIPATLHDSLMARLDRLGPAKEVAQIASVVGREFSYELLQAVSAMPEDDLQSALAKLGDAELIYARGIPARGHLFVQARADSGCGLRSTAQEPPSRACIDGRSRDDRDISRDGGDSARSRRAALDRCRREQNRRSPRGGRPADAAFERYAFKEAEKPTDTPSI